MSKPVSKLEALAALRLLLDFCNKVTTSTATLKLQCLRFQIKVGDGPDEVPQAVQNGIMAMVELWEARLKKAKTLQ